MNALTRITFCLLILSLPGCYWTADPSVILGVIFMALYAEEALIRFHRLSSATQLEKHFDDLQKEFDELRTQLNGVSMRMGMGGLPAKKI